MLRAVLHYWGLPCPVERAGTDPRVDSKFDDALHEILMMALGAFLDENDVPPFSERLRVHSPSVRH